MRNRDLGFRLRKKVKRNHDPRRFENHIVNMWSKMLIEILEKIFMSLSLVDFIHAGAVCTSWRLVMAAIVAQKFQPPSHQVPWLMLSRNKTTSICRLLNLFDSKVYNLHLPQADQAHILGSFSGWLILMDKRTYGLFLLNILSKQQIDLPCQANAWNSDYSSCIYYEDFWKIHAHQVYKVILSSAPTSGGCTFVIVYAKEIMAFCRLGDSAWTAMEGDNDPHPELSDIAFYDGRVLLASHIQWLTIYELGSSPKTIKPNLLPPFQIESVYGFNANSLIIFGGMYLVESCGELLLVLKSIRINVNTLNTRAEGFYVFKMDASRSDWIKVDNLGDQILFLGNGCSKSLSAKELSGFKGNHIFFTGNGLSHESGVFNLEDGSIERFPLANLQSSKKPFWVTPQLM
ncbi:hypothetical protein ACLOJK_000020 [Asimina triloba]